MRHQALHYKIGCVLEECRCSECRVVLSPRVEKHTLRSPALEQERDRQSLPQGLTRHQSRLASELILSKCPCSHNLLLSSPSGELKGIMTMMMIAMADCEYTGEDQILPRRKTALYSPGHPGLTHRAPLQGCGEKKCKRCKSKILGHVSAR